MFTLFAEFAFDEAAQPRFRFHAPLPARLPLQPLLYFVSYAFAAISVSAFLRQCFDFRCRLPAMRPPLSMLLPPRFDCHSHFTAASRHFHFTISPRFDAFTDTILHFAITFNIFAIAIDAFIAAAFDIAAISAGYVATLLRCFDPQIFSIHCHTLKGQLIATFLLAFAACYAEHIEFRFDSFH